MRILYVTERFPELSQTFVAREIEALIALGHEVRVVTLARGEAGDSPVSAVSAAEIPAFSRITMAAQQLVSSPVPSLRQIFREPNWPPPSGKHRLRGFLRLAAFLDEASWADHIHAHFATEAADIARLLAIRSATPWSFTAHGVDAYSDPRALAVNLSSAAFARAASDHVAVRLGEAAEGSEARIVEIPIAVAVDRFRRPGAYVPAGPIVSIGRLVEKKGFDLLIRALAQAPEQVRQRGLEIIGDGPLLEPLSQLAEGLDMKVNIVGALDNSEIPRRLWNASAFALTPRVAADGDRDGRPSVLIEAMAASLPIISSSMPGIDSLLTDEFGALAAVGDVEDIRLKIEGMFDLSPERRQAMGEAGRQLTAPYRPENVATALVSEFRRKDSGPSDPA
jgi:glycosyltransferase involved in cell wall biosynthesis